MFIKFIMPTQTTENGINSEELLRKMKQDHLGPQVYLVINIMNMFLP